MLKVIAALLLVVLCVKSGTSLNMWGSRVITQGSGPVTLYLEPQISPSDCNAAVFTNEYDRYTLKINTQTKECSNWQDGLGSAPCDYDQKTFQITFRDVTAQRKFTIRSKTGDTLYNSVIFAPHCKFATPEYDEVVPQESAPLSKFVKGQSDILIRFAIMGTDSQSEVQLSRNGKLICKWKGFVYVTGDGCGKNDLTRDNVNNVRIFSQTFGIPSIRDYYEWVGPKNSLSVTVDATQAGESPEMADCKKSQTPRLWGSRVVTQRSGRVNVHLEPLVEPTYCNLAVYPNEVDRYTLKINKNTMQCTYWNDSIWSTSCYYDIKKIQVSVKDVRAQRKLTVSWKGNDAVYNSVIFAPYCKFATPLYDEVVPQESAPLSKFVKGRSNVHIRFAIMGTDSQSEVKLYKNGDFLCQWKGIVYITGDGCGWEYLRPDYEKNIRVFRRNYSVPSTRDYYEFVGPKNSLSINVDGEQAGESPEMADCEYNRTSPKLWGSQIITQRSGPVTLNLETQGNLDNGDPDKCKITTIKGEMAEIITINPVSKQCLSWRGTEWSAPCHYSKTKLQITVKDVTARDKILIYNPEPYFTQLSVIFAPGCKFRALKEDEFVPKESAPLSKFVLGKTSVPITFAVKGSNSQSEVTLWKNGLLLCKWQGIRYLGGNGCGQINLIKDDVNNMKVFKRDFPVPTYVDFYAFHTPISELMVTVDGTQSGESTEMADC